MAPPRRPINERILENVEIDQKTLCWNWKGKVSKKGYGVITIGRRGTFSAHRISYSEFVGTIDDGMFVCHHCDNTKCVNPDHLFLGTASDNMRDMYRKGRNNNPYGTRHGAAKLNETAVFAIKAMLSDGISQRTIASGFFVSQMTISNIKRKKTWNNL